MGGVEETISPHPSPDPERHAIVAADRAAARTALRHLPTTASPRGTTRTYRTLIGKLCAADHPALDSLTRHAAQTLALADDRAQHLVVTLALLVARAGVDWSDTLVRATSTERVRTPR
ncbi:hypothetical protein LO762_09350 [Actinocorallia sp. API 0066]|uniref:hypothetical protein n=1 Tax=Actinocorallia sp. API 0066 TaxID=2896846 RepID=UPI001E2A2C49|nr:hypothetical protein [Actinocorallia sp. API 0066]MCD0449394.1 hypothetical protein [Actinocorallia sp. API 0066]